MKAASSPQNPETLLPEIRTDRNKLRRSTQYSRRKILQTGSVPEKPAPILPKAPISLFRKSLKQNVCVELLRDGDHRSFSELFSLLSSDRDRRAAAEPGSAVRLQTLLEEQWDKLETMKLHLRRAEQAERSGSPSVAYEQRLFLGQFFSSPEDLWLSFHFYHSCTDRGGGWRQAAEARACMADLYLQQGDLEQAKQQAEQCLQQAADGDWLDSAGRTLRFRAHQSLWRIYSRLADAPLNAADYSEALTLLHKGLSMASDAGYRQMEGEASYRLGLTYQRAGDHDKAKQFFNRCVQICSTLTDADGQVKAYKAMAKSIESQGLTHETVQCLEKLADVSRSNGLQHSLADAYLSLGNVLFKRGPCHRAADLFLQGYDAACQLEDVDLLQRAQVLVAIARAHSMIREYSAEVDSATPSALRRLLAWKETRARQEVSPDSRDPTATDGD